MTKRKNRRRTTSKDDTDLGVNFLIWTKPELYKKNGFNYAKTLFGVRKWVHTIHHILNGKLVETVYRED